MNVHIFFSFNPAICRCSQVQQQRAWSSMQITLPGCFLANETARIQKGTLPILPIPYSAMATSNLMTRGIMVRRFKELWPWKPAMMLAVPVPKQWREFIREWISLNDLKYNLEHRSLVGANFLTTMCYA